MRVLHVYSGNLYGGIETLLVTLARNRGLYPAMESHFALCFEGQLSRELVAAGTTVHHLGNVRVSRPATVLRARRALGKLLRGGGFDLVTCHSAWSQALFGPVVRSAGLPLVFWLHDAANGTRWLERWARFTPPDLTIANSRFTAGTLPRLYSGIPVEILHCPVASPHMQHFHAERSETRAEFRTAPDAVVIIQVSRLEPYKGHLLHLEALGILRDVPGWICWQVGGAQRPHEARYMEELVRAADRLGVAERVRFLGQRSDVPRLLAGADIHCQPNVSPEPFGIAFVEALYAGLPVVTTPIGGAKEIVNGSCGILVRPGDAGALADALGSLIQDPALRSRLAGAGPARARTVSDPAAQLARLGELLARTLRPELAV